MASLRIRALPVFDRSPSYSESIVPCDPPPSPTGDLTSIRFDSQAATPIRVISIVPRSRQSNEADNAWPPSIAAKRTTYDEHVLQYLSDSDCSTSDDEHLHPPSPANIDRSAVISKPKFSHRTPSRARPMTDSRSRSLPNRNSSCDAHENSSHSNRRSVPLKASVILPVYDHDERSAARNRSRAGAAATRPASAFGFSKTASSMHFGHAADRLNLHASVSRTGSSSSRNAHPFSRSSIDGLELSSVELR